VFKTDGGSEFKGVFNQYLYDESILHKGIVADRHNSMSNVESLNRQLSRLFNGYMNRKEEETGKVYREWTDVLKLVREDLNELRERKLPKNPNSYEYPLPKDYNTITSEKIVEDKKTGKKKTIEVTKNVKIEPKYKIGQFVYRALETPRDALNKKQNTKNFRAGDYTFEKTPREITQVFTMGGDGPLYRYYLEGIRDASFTERQLQRAPTP